eukprot:1040458-Alexandrium_andersonii.AAC.1
MAPSEFHGQGRVGPLESPHAGHHSGMLLLGQEIPCHFTSGHDSGQVHRCLQSGNVYSGACVKIVAHLCHNHQQ